MRYPSSKGRPLSFCVHLCAPFRAACVLENKIWKLDLSAYVEQRIRENKGVLGFKQHDKDVTSVYDFGDEKQ